jgi:cell division septum initiation protein DivIVA
VASGGFGPLGGGKVHGGYQRRSFVNDNQIKARVKAVLSGSPDSATSEHPLVNPGIPMQNDHALQVLTLAQRTAEEHVAIAKRQADKIREDAQAAADQSARDAQVHAHNVRCEADKVLAEARATSEQAARDARLQAEDAKRGADQVLAGAKEEAGSIVGTAQGQAQQLRMQAQQRYEDSVGSLISKREALQQQIESLEQFDREYRARLTTFMQGQLRELWVDRPQVGTELQAPVTAIEIETVESPDAAEKDAAEEASDTE